MTIDKVGSASGAGASPALRTGKEQFAQVLRGAQGEGTRPKVPVAMEGTPRPVSSEAVRGTDPARAVERASAGKVEATQGTRVDSVQAARMLMRVEQAQLRLDKILELAESGRAFTPAELLALQAHVYRASQELDLAGKVVEKATSGVKQVLQTQV